MKDALSAEVIPVSESDAFDGVETVSPSSVKKPTGVKKRKPAIKRVKISEERMKFMQQCNELEKLEKKAEKLHSEGHICIRVYHEMSPPLLYWCKQKRCVMASPLAPTVVVE